jgi:hypothetical protein
VRRGPRYLHCDRVTAGFGGELCGVYFLFKQVLWSLQRRLSAAPQAVRGLLFDKHGRFATHVGLLPLSAYGLSNVNYPPIPMSICQFSGDVYTYRNILQ